MRIRFLQAASTTLMINGLVFLTASCSSVITDGSALPSRAQRLTLQQRITQFHFGRNATYAVCVEPACPTVTPKTLAVGGSASAPAYAPAVPTAASNAVKSPSEHLMLRFQSGSSRLEKEAKRALDQFLPIARKSERIIIIGRTDNVGSVKGNNTVALARAQQVRNYLRQKTFDVDNTIEIDAKGSCCFVSSNDTREGRQENRRVEVVFTSHG